jgi:hypothetical protein
LVPAPSQDQRGGHRPARLVHHHRGDLGSAQERHGVDSAGVADDRHTGPDAIRDTNDISNPDIVDTDAIGGTGTADSSLDEGGCGASGDGGFGGAGRAQHP